MSVRRLVSGCIWVWLCVLVNPAGASAQDSSIIVGVARDTSGAVLPGVTVEATSPALIEKVRTVVTNDQGLYRIVDLRPGRYTVTFSLVGFNTYKREDVDLPASFTLMVNSDMKIGGIEETIVVTGQSPLVDVQTVTTATRLTRDTIDSLPTPKSNMTMVALMPSAVTAANTQDVGGSKGEFSNKAVVHGGKPGDQKFMQDGMQWNGSYGSGNGSGFYVNAAAAQEVVVEAGAGGSAEYATGGVSLNVIPKDGGNVFSGYFTADYSGKSMGSDNLSDELKARGLVNVNKTSEIFNVSLAGGGAIKKDYLWFYYAYRKEGNRAQLVNYYFNGSPNPLLYVADLSRPGYALERNLSNNLRLTWQASKKNKIAVTGNLQDNCNCPNNETQNLAPEAVMNTRRKPSHLMQATWNSTVSNKILLEAGAAWLNFQYKYELDNGATPESISINDTGLGIRYGAPLGTSNNPSPSITYRGAMSYVTGSHYLKTGISWKWGSNGQQSFRSASSVAYTFNNGRPTQITEYAAPLRTLRILKPDMGLYIQDRWTMGRLTLSPGLRLDYLGEYVPASTQVANRFLPERSYGRVDCVPCWRDLNPRFSAAYDLFGDGKTAVLGSIGRYVAAEVSTTAGQNDPNTTVQNSVNRSWTDFNNNFFPDCDLTNPGVNGLNNECAAVANGNFGKQVVSTFYDPDLLTGWGKRSYNWRTSLEFKHQLLASLAVQAGYYRTWYGNFRVTDNRTVSPSDYDPFCVTAPSNPNLPGGGGNSLCGFYNLNPSKFGAPANNYVTWASNFGKQSEVYNGADFLVNARLPGGGLLQGGVNIGNSVVTSVGSGSSSVSATNQCFVVDSPQQLRNCDVHPPLVAQLKLVGSYQLPKGVSISANIQSLPGYFYEAIYAAPNSAITGLGRPLSGSASTVSTSAALERIDLLDPFAGHEDRIFQLDVRAAKKFTVRGVKMQGQFDIYNLTNGNTVLSNNGTYGASWRQPTEVLNARLMKVGMQMSF